MSADDFIDSNVFVYLFDETDPVKRQRAERLVREAMANGTGCISYQVVQETLNAVGRITGADSGRLVELLNDVLIPLWQINPTASMYQGLSVFLFRHSGESRNPTPYAEMSLQVPAFAGTTR